MLGLTLLFTTGAAVTGVWLAVAHSYIIGRLGGYAALVALHPSDLAALIAGVFGPVAALWLVLGFLRQGFAIQRLVRGIRQFAGQLKHNSDQVEAVCRGILEGQQHQRNELVVRNLTLSLADLNGSAADIALRYGLIDRSELGPLWTRIGNGDHAAVSRVFLQAAADDPALADKLGDAAAGDAAMKLEILLFLRHYERLLDVVKAHDMDGLIREIVEDGGLGRLHGFLRPVGRGGRDAPAAAGAVKRDGEDLSASPMLSADPLSADPLSAVSPSTVPQSTARPFSPASEDFPEPADDDPADDPDDGPDEVWGDPSRPRA